MRNVISWLEQQDDIAIVVHVNPDGDAYGSALAMAAALVRMGKRAFVAADPVPARYAFLPFQDLICQQFPFAPKAVLHMDVSTKDRAGAATDEQIPSCLIDHHVTNEGFDDVRYIDGEASSTGEIVVGLFEQMHVAIDADMAVCLYTAIATDTGNFQFSGTTAKAMRAAATLLESGLDIGRISGYLFRTRTEGHTRLLGEALHTMSLWHDNTIATVIISKDMLSNCGSVRADIEGIVNYLNEIDGVKVAALIEERDGITKLSLRSNAGIDVARVAGILGGGGHKAAAGASYNGGLEEAQDMIVKLLREAVVR